MKLSDIKPVIGKFYLKHPVTHKNLQDDNEQDVYWHVVGQDSDEYLQSQQEFLKHIEALGDKADKMTAVDYKQQTAIQLSKVVTGWDEKFNDFMNGEFSLEIVENLLLSQDHKWIVNQLDLFVAQRSNFFTD